MEHHWFTPSENQETSHDHLRSIAMRRLEMEFIKLQEAMNKSKDITQTMRLLKEKALSSKTITCVRDKMIALILQALRQNDFHVLSESFFDAVDFFEEMQDVSSMLEEINNHEETAMICQ